MAAPEFHTNFWVGHGFDDLKAHTRTGLSHCEAISGILRERASISADYAKSLLKLGNKVEGTGKDMLGTLKASWTEFKAQLEGEARWHQDMAKKVVETLADPLVGFRKEQKKERKPIEAYVDKAHSELIEARSQEQKLKRSYFFKVRDMETAWDQYTSANSGKGRVYTDKEISKYLKSAKKLEEEVEKKDKEYRVGVKKLEKARRQWEAAMEHGCHELQVLEASRLSYLKALLSQYQQNLQSFLHEHETGCSRLESAVTSIDELGDIQKAAEIKGTGSTRPPEVLYDCYEEDKRNPMDAQRRQTRLEQRIRVFEEDLRATEKTLAGIENLAERYNQTPSFADEQGQADVMEQLNDNKRRILSLRATIYKMESSLCEALGRSKPDHEFKTMITLQQDSHDHRQALFTVEDISSVGGYERKPNLTHQPSTQSAQDEFSDDEQEAQYYEEEEEPVIGHARVLFDYESQKEDELNIMEGDIVDVTAKYEDGWWKGRCNGQEGIFPEAYCEPID